MEETVAYVEHGSDTMEDPGFECGNPAELCWSKITCKLGRQEVLRGVSGKVQGKMLAILGSSGAGKTTLLNILAQRNRSGVVGGDVWLNGEKITPSMMKRSCGYVMQDDLFFQNLSVFENLLFAARLRLPSSVPDDIKQKRVKMLIDQFGLKNCMHSRVGGPTVRGISGGERKRLSIAVELIANMHLLFLDEPTTGLDASTAFNIVSKLKQHTSYCTIVCTIHQPSSKIFHLFDDLMVMSRGKVIYFGQQNDAVPYFAELGYVCPALANPADYIMSLISADPSDAENIIKIIEQTQDMITQYSKNHADENQFEPENFEKLKQRYLPGIVSQFYYLLGRAATNYYRGYFNISTQLLQNILIAVLIGLVFLDLPLDQTGVSRRFQSLFFVAINQGVFATFPLLTSFPLERDIVLRERSSAIYKTLPYFLAKSLTELPLQIIFPLIFTNIVYWMCGYQNNFIKWANFWILVELCNMAAISMGLFFSAVSPNMLIAFILAPLFAELWRLFGGFYGQPVPLPGYILWIQTISYINWTFQGLAMNEMSGLDFYCLPDQLKGGVCPVTSGEQALEKFSFFDVPIWGCELILVGITMTWRVLAYVAVRFNKF